MGLSFWAFFIENAFCTSRAFGGHWNECWLSPASGPYAYPKRLYSWNVFEGVLRECPSKF